MYTLIATDPSTERVLRFADIPAKHVAKLAEIVLEEIKAAKLYIVNQEAGQPAQAEPAE